ncbi:MAG: hypothetical protein AMXMBFR84_13210 [Candidatus Hydrogenedentota bacterium]
MRPVLFSIGNTYIGAYSTAILLAVLTALATLFWRVKRDDIHFILLIPMLSVALLCGWMLSRSTLLFDPRHEALGLRVFSPFQKAPSSFTVFAIGAGVALLIGLAPLRLKAVDYLDALAPSALLGLAVAKWGCVFAGCCAGGLAPAYLGITYPYGSTPYETQWRSNLIVPPRGLVHTTAEGETNLWGHEQFLHLRREQFQRLLDRFPDEVSGKSATDIAHLAGQTRSLPVWPTPILFSLAALALGIVAEQIYRKGPCRGATLAFVLLSYGVLRLTLDSLLATRVYVIGGLAVSQWIGLAALGLGLLLLFRTRRSALRKADLNGDGETTA